LDVQEQKFNASISSLGARWGIYSEASFRSGLKAILEQSFGVTVKNFTEIDEEGDERARQFAETDGIEVYSHSFDVDVEAKTTL